jgi:hypothetical protein
VHGIIGLQYTGIAGSKPALNFMFVRVNSCRGLKVDVSHIQGILQYDLICCLGGVD